MFVIGVVVLQFLACTLSFYIFVASTDAWSSCGPRIKENEAPKDSRRANKKRKKKKKILIIIISRRGNGELCKAKEERWEEGASAFYWYLSSILAPTRSGCVCRAFAAISHIRTCGKREQDKKKKKSLGMWSENKTSYPVFTCAITVMCVGTSGACMCGSYCTKCTCYGLRLTAVVNGCLIRVIFAKETSSPNEMVERKKRNLTSWNEIYDMHAIRFVPSILFLSAEEPARYVLSTRSQRCHVLKLHRLWWYCKISPSRDLFSSFHFDLLLKTRPFFPILLRASHSCIHSLPYNLLTFSEHGDVRPHRHIYDAKHAGNLFLMQHDRRFTWRLHLQECEHTVTPGIW